MWQNALHIHKHGRTRSHTLMCVYVWEQASRNRVQEIQRDESECGGLSALSLFTGRVLPGQLPYTSAVIIMCHANLETPAWTKKLERAWITSSRRAFVAFQTDGAWPNWKGPAHTRTRPEFWWCVRSYFKGRRTSRRVPSVVLVSLTDTRTLC